jgi:Tfp pilus assembly protein FimT
MFASKNVAIDMAYKGTLGGISVTLPQPRLSANQTGVSMIEVLVVLCISMIMTAATIPSFRNTWQSYQLNAVVANVNAGIQSARYQAIMQGYPFQITVDTSSVTYQLSSKPPGAGSFSNVGGAIPLGTASGVTISQATTLQFKPNGAVTAIVGSLSLSVTYAGTTRTLTVSPNGNVSIA